MSIDFATAPVPDTDGDEAPDTESPTGDYDPQYPGSTPEAPYGYFDDGRPRKRRPRGTGSTTATGSRRMAATETQARSAANLLARMNSLIGFSLITMGLPMTAAQLAANNDDFAQMAYEALLTDPALCRKILSAGANSGKAGLVMAYVMLGGSIVPTAVGELKERRAVQQAEEKPHDEY